MSDTVIKVENISKQYRLGEVSTATLSHDINRWWHTVRGKENPYLKIGESNDRTKRGINEYVWALKNINFELKQGEVLGIIGRNGAGKSTLLKILSRTTSPTTGVMKVKGRLASLLEVGTGFHPELSGRDNIFLNGAILGMQKSEIKRKFDEIVDFSGVERYIDTPVKRYSSGMYVRLAFAVAAHLESEILIIDEVLAVGDSEFQKKCLGKMSEISQGEGRTILFVSHNIASIKQLCSCASLMVNGEMVFQGTVEDASKLYLAPKSLDSLGTYYVKNNIENNPIELLEAKITNQKGIENRLFESDDEIFIELKIKKNLDVAKAVGYLAIMNLSEEVYIETDTLDFSPNILDQLSLGPHTIQLKIPPRLLPNGSFVVYLNFSSELSLTGFILDNPREILHFEISDHNTVRGMNRRAYTNIIIKWSKHD